MQNQIFQISAQALSFEHSNGSKVFTNLSFTLGSGRYGLVGPNGVGKSTLAKLLSGDLRATAGDLIRSHDVVYLAQMEPRPNVTVAELLIELWESPFADSAQWGPLLAGISLEQVASSLSGGEWTRVRIAKALAKPAGLLILDEPTNNLDSSACKIVHEFVQNFSGGLLVISHDRELLELMDSTLELSSQGVQIYGGPYSFYRDQKDKESERDAATLDRLRREKKKVERERHEKMQSQEKRMRRGQDHSDKGGIPKILLGARKRNAEETQGTISRNEDKRVDKAQGDFKQFHLAMKNGSQLRLPGLEVTVPSGKMIFSLDDLNFMYFENGRNLWRENLSWTMKGPARWALTGGNGAGKSTLIKLLLSSGALPKGILQGRLDRADLRIGYLDQEYSILDFNKSVLENVSADNSRDIVGLRNELAAFQFMKDQALQKVVTLSGGEKLKAALAKLFLSDKPPQFLILDEPTNNLDLDSLEVLEGLLKSYQGALLVVSHDQIFLENIGIQEVRLLQS